MSDKTVIELIEGIRSVHYARPITPHDAPADFTFNGCSEDGHAWPCAASILADRLEAESKVADGALKLAQLMLEMISLHPSRLTEPLVNEPWWERYRELKLMR